MLLSDFPERRRVSRVGKLVLWQLSFAGVVGQCCQRAGDVRNIVTSGDLGCTLERSTVKKESPD